MTGIVNDDFNFPQTNGSVVGPSPQWTPSSMRDLFASNISTTDISGGFWHFNITSGTLSAVNLEYFLTTPQDFTTMMSIMLMGVTANNPATPYTLNLQDTMAHTQQIDALNISGTVTWNLNAFLPPLDLTQIMFMTIFIHVGLTGAVIGSVDTLTSTIVCLAKDTNILMSDGSERTIQNIKRGDLVAGNKEITLVHKVARNIITKFNEKYLIDMVRIEKDVLDEEVPNRETLISGWHPILWKGVRRPARCFEKIKGVKWYYHTISAGEILPMDDNSEEKTYSLYNLQYDHDGMYVANNMIVQAVSPYSELVPLKRELFYEEKNYKEQLTWESYITETSWDCTEVL